MGNDGDPRFNGGQQLHVHDGGVRRQVVDELAERGALPAEPDRPVDPLPPDGTVGADQARVAYERDVTAGAPADRSPKPGTTGPR
ncbi:MAG TPA: hypothetical protein VF763_11845 [Candidatus Limnocylindrales bacterium]